MLGAIVTGVLGDHGADRLDPEAAPVNADEIHGSRILGSSLRLGEKNDAVLRIPLAFRLVGLLQLGGVHFRVRVRVLLLVV